MIYQLSFTVENVSTSSSCSKGLGKHFDKWLFSVHQTLKVSSDCLLWKPVGVYRDTPKALDSEHLQQCTHETEPLELLELSYGRLFSFSLPHLTEKYTWTSRVSVVKVNLCVSLWAQDGINAFGEKKSPVSVARVAFDSEDTTRSAGRAACHLLGVAELELASSPFELWWAVKKYKTIGYSW